MAERTSTLVFMARDAASGPIKSIDRAMDGLHAGTRRVTGGLGKLGGGLLGVGKSAFSLTGLLVGGGLIAAMNGAAEAAAGDEASVKRLDTAIKANVKGSRDYTKALEATIAAGQKLAFSDDDTRASLTRLITSTRSVTAATKLNALAMDLARLKGMDLADAANIIGKVHDGNIGILSRYGITVAKGATATQALAQIQAAAAGQAKTYGDSSKGALDRVKDGFSEAAEAAGKLLIPAMAALVGFVNTAVLPTITTIIGNIGAWVAANQPLIDQVKAFAVGALAGFGSLLGEIGTRFSGLVTGIGNWLAANQPLIDQVKAFAVGALADLRTLLGEVVTRIGEVVTGAGNWLAANQPLIDQLTSLGGSVLTAFVDGVRAIVRVFTDFGPLVPIIAGVTVAVLLLNAAVRANPIVLIVSTIIVAIGLLVEAWDSDFGGMRTTILKFFDDIKPVTDEIGRLFGKIAKDVLPALGTAFGAMATAVGIVVDAIKEVIRLAGVAVGAVSSVPGVKLGSDSAGGLGDMLSKARGDDPRIKRLLPGFADGGVVPGAIGQPTLAVVHGGERVLTPNQGAGGGLTIAPGAIVINGGGMDPEAIARAVMQAFQRERQRQNMSFG